MPAKGWGSPKNSFYGKDGPAPTWKHGGRALTNVEKDWITANGWKLPQ